jgi:hypothetical protein
MKGEAYMNVSSSCVPLRSSAGMGITESCTSLATDSPTSGCKPVVLASMQPGASRLASGQGWGCAVRTLHGAVEVLIPEPYTLLRVLRTLHGAVEVLLEAVGQVALGQLPRLQHALRPRLDRLARLVQQAGLQALGALRRRAH